MQSGTNAEDMVYKVVFSEPALIFDNPVAFDTANSVFYPYPDAGHIRVVGFLLLGEFFSAGFLDGLTDAHPLGLVALIAGILPEGETFGNRIAGVGNLFVMHAAGHGRADKENIAQGGGDDSVLNGMLFLFATVLFLLLLWLPRAGYFPFTAIVKQVFTYFTIS